MNGRRRKPKTALSGYDGDAPLVGFSPRKAKISLYFVPGDEAREALLQDFGKHTTGKGCVDINKVADINVDVLKAIIDQSVKFLLQPLHFYKANNHTLISLLYC